jgi:hypothetical protein
MTFELSWLLNGRVLHARVFGAMTDTDNALFDDAVETALNRQASLPVHLLLDYSGVERIQSHISPVGENNPPSKLAKHPLLGLRVAVQNPLLRFVPAFLSSALKPPGQQYASLDGALRYLADADPTLTPRSERRMRVRRGRRTA